MKMEPIEVSETSTYSIPTPGNYPKERNILIVAFLRTLLKIKIRILYSNFFPRKLYAAGHGAEYVRLVAFPGQQWLRERASILRL
jgi:hypothetical protein